MSEKYQLRTCPACINQTHHHLAMSSEPKAESLTLEQIKGVWSGFFTKKSFFTYHRCDQCQLLFCPQFFTEEQLTNLYASMSDNTAGVPLAPLIKTQNSYFHSLKKFMPTTRGGFLEFGPDIGLFTRCCVKDRLFDDYWLIEPNKDVWPALELEVKKETFHLAESDGLIDSIPNKSISVVVMIHVLDHLLQPLELLRRIKPKLKDDAVMLFVTHDESSLLAKAIKSKWPPYCLQHPQLYNKKTISGLLGKVDMYVKGYERTKNYFPVMYLIKHFLFVLGIKKIPLPKWSKFQIGLKLGNLLTVASLNGSQES